ncbi:MAG TPA: tetratricopeptide repeat protein [Burkholderiales bacterium]|nr:tetratricopeptide repeat protein [Burkholderiales bacterium]
MTSSVVRRLAWVAALLITFFSATAAYPQVDELQEASQLLKQGQLERALDRVDAFLKSRPKDARGRFLKGLILAEQNKPDDAIRVFTDLTQEYPELPEPYNNLAVLYASQGPYDKARSALEMAIRTHPSYATAHENLGDIYAKLASRAYDKAFTLDKGNTAAQTKLNLIKDLFSGSPREPKAAPGSTTGRIASLTPAPRPDSVSKQPSRAAEPKTPSTPAPVKDNARPAQPTPKPAPAPKAAEPAPPVPSPAPAPKAASPARDQDEVMKSVNQWARAWSNNDVAGYLGYYAADFQAPKGESRDEWERKREALIAKPRRIQVGINSPKVTFTEAGRATVTFLQHYRSGKLNVKTSKTLVMIKTGEKWLIQQERVGG